MSLGEASRKVTRRSLTVENVEGVVYVYISVMCLCQCVYVDWGDVSYWSKLVGLTGWRLTSSEIFSFCCVFGGKWATFWVLFVLVLGCLTMLLDVISKSVAILAQYDVDLGESLVVS